MGGSALCDIIITVAIVIIVRFPSAGKFCTDSRARPPYPKLYRRKNRTHFEPSVSILNRLMRFSVETGVITSLTALLELILYLIMPDNKYYWIMYVVSSTEYTKLMLAKLGFCA